MIYKNIDVNIEETQTVKSFISQFKDKVDGILCIVDEDYVKILNKGEIPLNKTLVRTVQNEQCKEYYFVDRNTKTQYCIFGNHDAKLFGRNFNSEENKNKKHSKSKNKQSLTIIDIDGSEETFEIYDFETNLISA